MIKSQNSEVKSTISSSVRQSKTVYSQFSAKEAEKSIKALSVFDRLSQIPSKKPSIIDQNAFPCVKFEESNSQLASLPLFIELNLGHHKNEKSNIQKQVRLNENDKKPNGNYTKDPIKYSDFPLLIQSVLGGDTTKNIISNDKLSIKTRNLTPGYRKKPYQYITNLSYYKKWDLTE